MLLSTTNEVGGKINKVTMGITIGSGIIVVGEKELENYEETLNTVIDKAFKNMSDNAKKLGATAIIGISVDYKTINRGAKIVATAIGTAVIAE